MVDYRTFNLQAFVNWVAQQPPRKAYDPGAVNACALAQFGYPGVATVEAEMMGILWNGLYTTIIAPRRTGVYMSRPTFGNLRQALSDAGYEPQPLEEGVVK